MLSRKHIRAPATFDPGADHPLEHLAYLSREEMELLRRMTDGKASRGPKGIPSFVVSPDAKGFGSKNNGPGGGSLNSPVRTAPSGGGGGQKTPSGNASRGPGASMAAAKASSASKTSNAPKAPSSSTQRSSPPRNLSGIGSPTQKAPSRPSAPRNLAGIGSPTQKAPTSPVAPMGPPRNLAGIGSPTQKKSSAVSTSKTPSALTAPKRPSGGFSQTIFGSTLNPAKRMPGRFGGSIPHLSTPASVQQPVKRMPGRFGGLIPTLGTGINARPVNYALTTPQIKSTWEKTQELFGRKLHVNEGWRDKRKASKNSAPKSQHYTGNAIDVDVRGLSIAQRQALIAAGKKAGFKGFGVGANIVHFDLGKPRSWGYKNGKHGGPPPSWARSAIAGEGPVVAATKPAKKKTGGLQTASSPSLPVAPVGPIPRPVPRPEDLRGPIARPVPRPDNLITGKVARNPYDTDKSYGVPKARPAGVAVAPRPTLRPENFKNVAGMSFNPNLPAPMPPRPTPRPENFKNVAGMSFNPSLPAPMVGPPIPRPRPDMQGPPRPIGGMSFNPNIPEQQAPSAVMPSREPEGHWKREETNYLNQIGALPDIMSDPYAREGYRLMQNPDGTGLRLGADTGWEANYGTYTPETGKMNVRTDLSPTDYGDILTHELGHVGAGDAGLYNLKPTKDNPWGDQYSEERRQELADAALHPAGTLVGDLARARLEGYATNPRASLVSTDPRTNIPPGSYPAEQPPVLKRPPTAHELLGMPPGPLPSYPPSEYSGYGAPFGIPAVPGKERGPNPFSENANKGLPPGYAERYGLDPPASAVSPGLPYGLGPLSRGISGLLNARLPGKDALHIPGLKEAVDALPAYQTAQKIGGFIKAKADEVANERAGFIKKAAADAIRAAQSYLKPENYAPRPKAGDEKGDDIGRSGVGYPLRETKDGGGKESRPSRTKGRSGRKSSVDGGRGNEIRDAAVRRLLPLVLPPLTGGGSKQEDPQADWSYYNAVLTKEEALRRLLGEEWFA